MSPTSAIIMLSCIYWGALFGGAITSILFNIPGEPWSVATTFDGYPMAQQGRADEALTGAFTSSFVGALAGVIVITFLAPVVARFALRFGPAEFFAVQFLTFASFIGMGRGSPFKTLASMCLGFALASVGLDTVTGQLRMTFGITDLLTGFKFLTAVIGLFGIGEILISMEAGLAFSGTMHGSSSAAGARDMEEAAAVLDDVAAELRHRLLDGHHPGRRHAGVVHELRPGEAVREARRRFGTGQLEGVVAAETAAHAAGTSALLPMLTLGIPGSPTAAVLLGGLLIWGLQPGPLLFVEQKEFVWGLIASMYLGNLAGLIIVLTLRSAVRGDSSRAVQHHRAGDHGRLRGRRLHRQQRDVRYLADAGVRRRSATCSTSCRTRWRRWCWRSCSATWPRARSARRCCCRRAACRSSGRTRWLVVSSPSASSFSSGRGRVGGRASAGSSNRQSERSGSRGGER